MSDVTSPTGGLRVPSARLVSLLTLPAIIVLLLFVFVLFEPNVLTAGNLSNIAIQTSYLTIFALAQTYVVIVRGFDLSLGTSVSLVSVASAMTMVFVMGQTGAPALAIACGIAAGLLLGLAVGAVNGFFIAFLALNPFVVTLATLNICLGFASTISGGFQIFDVPAAFNGAFYQSRWLGLPAPVAIALILLLISDVVLRHLRLGRSLLLIGSNPQAAHVAGLPVKRTLLVAYMTCGVIAAFGGLLLTARTGSGEPNLGGNLMLESIAAAVMGGASLRGGKGNVASPLLGALLITVLSNGMNLTRVDGYVQQVILGAVIVATVCVNSYKKGERA
jgi:ribose transport system permease protein